MAVKTLRGGSSKEKITTVISNVIHQNWTRNPEWLVMPTILATDEKFILLAAIYPDNNYFACIASGIYNVNWGDGTSSLNVAAGAIASAIITYSSIAGNTEIGIASAQAVTFTTGSNLVTLANHGYISNEEIAFSVTTIPGVIQYQRYYVNVVSASTFTISAICRGTTLIISSGTGAIYTPQYRQTLITITPVTAGTFISLNLNIRHPILPTNLIGLVETQFLEINGAGQNLTDLFIASTIPGSIPVSPSSYMTFNMLEKFNLFSSSIRQFGSLFSLCKNIQSVSISPQTNAIVYQACTLTTGTNLVTAVAHTFRNGDLIIFSTLLANVGILTGTGSYIINTTANTFQISTTYGGSAIVFCPLLLTEKAEAQLLPNRVGV